MQSNKYIYFEETNNNNHKSLSKVGYKYLILIRIIQFYVFILFLREIYYIHIILLELQ